MGIDAGGSSTRAVAARGDAIVFARSAGAGNPMSVPADVIVANYLEALASCPHPSAVVACVAGIGVGPGLELIERVLNARFAGSRVKVLPDYEAAWALAPDATDVVVIAGTGSVITSRDRHGYRVSGGRGLRDGDPGSAVKLGRLLLEERRFPVAADSQRGPARFAGVLTAAAEEGASWACRIVDREMQALALQLKQHVREVGAARPSGSSSRAGFSRATSLATPLPSRSGLPLI